MIMSMRVMISTGRPVATTMGVVSPGLPVAVSVGVVSTGLLFFEAAAAVAIGPLAVQDAVAVYARALFRYGERRQQGQRNSTVDLTDVPPQPTIPKSAGRIKDGASKYTGVHFRKQEKK